MRPRRLAIVLLLCAPAALAQFKWLDSSGRIGYGDKPPPGAHDIESLEGVSKGARPDPAAQLPYQLQRTIREFPVTLYTMTDCKACDDGRTMLRERAVPFSERTVRTREDLQALQQLTGSDRLPAFKVGSRIIVGFNGAQWSEALDLAGYPHHGQLPSDWVWAPPQPLTEAKPAQPPPAADQPGAAPPADSRR